MACASDDGASLGAAMEPAKADQCRGCHDMRQLTRKRSDDRMRGEPVRGGEP